MQLKASQIAVKDFIIDKSEVTIAASPIHGLNVHKQNYFKNLLQALGQKYPTVAQIYDNSARKLLYDYIRAQAPVSPDLDDYGDDFTDYLIQLNLLSEASFAQIDYSVFKSSSNYARPISASELSHVTPDDFDRLTFLLNPTLHVIKVDCKDLGVWCELHKDRAHIKGLDQLNMRTGNLAIYQLNDMSVLELIPEGYFKSIELIREGVNILELATKVLEIDTSFNLSAFLAFCFRNNLVIGFKLA